MKNLYKEHGKRISNRKKRRYGRFLNVMLLVSVVLTASIVYNTRYVSAHEKNMSAEAASVVHYKSIMIHAGDNLWDIATEYVTDDFDSVNDYIRFLKNVNNLTGDTICANQTLIVAYAAE